MAYNYNDLRIVNEGDGPSHVCSLLHMYGFGEGQAAGYTKSAHIVNYGYGTFDEFKAAIKDAALKLDKVNPIRTNAMVVAYATSVQPKAQQYLRDLGFTEFAVPEFFKYNHGISQFTIHIKDFCAIVGIEYKDEDEYGGYVVRRHFLARWKELEGAGFTPEQIEAELGLDPEVGATLYD